MLLWSRGPNTNLGRARKAYINPSLDLIGSFTWGPQFLRGSTSCTNFARLSDSNRTTSAANVCLPRAASRFSKTPFAIESIRTSAGRDNELCCIQQAKKMAIAPGLLAHHKFIARVSNRHLLPQGSKINAVSTTTTIIKSHTWCIQCAKIKHNGAKLSDLWNSPLHSYKQLGEEMPAHIISGFQRKKLPNQKGILDGLLSKFSDLLELAQKVGHSPLHILDAALSISIVWLLQQTFAGHAAPPGPASHRHAIPVFRPNAKAGTMKYVLSKILSSKWAIAPQLLAHHSYCLQEARLAWPVVDLHERSTQQTEGKHRQVRVCGIFHGPGQWVTLSCKILSKKASGAALNPNGRRLA